MQIINTPQDPRSSRSSPDAKLFAKTHSFQDPRNFTSTIHSNNRVQTPCLTDSDTGQGHHYSSYRIIVHTH